MDVSSEQATIGGMGKYSQPGGGVDQERAVEEASSTTMHLAILKAIKRPIGSNQTSLHSLWTPWTYVAMNQARS